MSLLWVPLFASLFVLLVNVDAVDQAPFTCDEIVPSELRCNLKESQHQVSVQGLNVTYWVFEADDNSTTDHELPAIIGIHGGPAYTHNYMLPLKYAACQRRRVILYDQAGCGESSLVYNVSQNYPWLLTIDYYVDIELPAIIAASGVAEFYLFGHSWGTVVVQEYAIRQPSEQMLGIIIAGPLSDAKLYISAQRKYVQSTLPLFIREKIDELEQQKDYLNPVYTAISDHLTGMFTIRTVPYPQCFVDCLGGVNMEIYVTMQGASEFTVGGVLENWNITGELHKIRVPALVTRGQFDTMAKPVTNVIVQEIPEAFYFEHKSSAHISFIDSPSTVLASLKEFTEFVEHPHRLRKRRHHKHHDDDALTEFEDLLKLLNE